MATTLAEKLWQRNWQHCHDNTELADHCTPPEVGEEGREERGRRGRCGGEKRGEVRRGGGGGEVDK